MRNTAKVTLLQTLLFGGQLRLDVDGKIEMDEWLPFHIRHSDPGFGARLALEFRKALDRVLFRAFESLEDVTPDKGRRFADDPVRENFVQRAVQVLSMKETGPVEALKECNDLLLKHGD
jgi:ATP-dependent RNA helicase DHX36